MKRTLFAALALVLIASLAWGWMGALVGGGVAATAPTCTIDEDFADALSDWTNTCGAVTASSGVGVGNAWAFNLSTSPTSIGSANQTATFRVNVPATGNSNDLGGVALRISTSTGYVGGIAGNGVAIIKAADSCSADTFIGSGDTYAAGWHDVEFSVNGTTLTLTIDGGTPVVRTNSTYSTGNSAGAWIRRSADNSALEVDDLCVNIY